MRSVRDFSESTIREKILSERLQRVEERNKLLSITGSQHTHACRLRSRRADERNRGTVHEDARGQIALLFLP